MNQNPNIRADQPGEAFKKLYDTVCLLRAPDGCPWDREQTPLSMRTMLLEEAFEVIDAIDAGDDVNLREELGDVILIATMITRMKEQEQAFSTEDVLFEVVEKLRRRHPHVFKPEDEHIDASSTDDYPTDAEGVLSQWNRIKASEHKSNPAQTSAIKSTASGPSPLRNAVDLQPAASKVGFDWDSIRPVFEKVAEELGEVDQASAVGPERSEEELGDLLFTVVNLSRHLRVDPLLALNGANERFRRRFQALERRVRDAGETIDEMTLPELDRHWEEVKRAENRKPMTATGRAAASSIPTDSNPVHNAEPP